MSVVDVFLLACMLGTGLAAIGIGGVFLVGTVAPGVTTVILADGLVGTLTVVFILKYKFNF